MTSPARRQSGGAGRPGSGPGGRPKAADRRNPRASRPAARDPLVGTEIELVLDRPATGGICVARHEGRVVFVRHALPGERVRALVTDGSVGSSYIRADALEVLGEPSVDRVEPPCPHAGPGKCGGCDFQHVDLAAQRTWKSVLVTEQLARVAGITREVVVEALPDPEGADAPGLGWRTRVQFALTPAGRTGLRKNRSHDVLQIEDCPLGTAGVREVGVGTREWRGATGVEVIAGAAPHDDRAVVVTTRLEDYDAPLLDVPTSIMRSDDKGRVTAQRGRPGVREHADGHDWRVSGSGFWQVHPSAAATLLDAVLEALDPRAGETAVDLYCGVGLFAGALATRLGSAGSVTAVEMDVAAAADCELNLAALGAGSARTRVRTGRVEDVLLTSGLRKADLVVLDPPRAGAGESVLAWVGSLQPRTVAYVACDPASLARDLKYCLAAGWELHDVRAFDLFPMTQHVESLAVLSPPQVAVDLTADARVPRKAPKKL